MIDHYNAFISYKHADLDSKIAAHVQKSLEHFKIPGAIRKKTGMKRIERVFRDKDELPITSDLSETIENALRNADYLIVICSPNTKQSMWVEREIKFFLKNHTLNQVLTVIADGEPYDVIPSILLKEEKEITNDDGSITIVNLDKEPLSCDYRMPMRKADKEELPRLACALIGCSYDELMNRRRQYRMRRMALIFAGIMALTIAFGAYMLHSKMQIEKSYNEALRSQSITLAHQSIELMDDDNRVEATQVALAALPESNERPVVAEAIRALNNATLAYVPRQGFAIEPLWNYSMPNEIASFVVSPLATSLVTVDTSGKLYSWKTSDHTINFETNIGDGDVVYLNDDVILVVSEHGLVAYNASNGDELWDYDTDEYYDTDDVCIVDQDYFCLSEYGAKIVKFKISDGSVVKEYNLPSTYQDEDISIVTFQMSPNGSKIAFTGYLGYSDYYLGVFDTNNNSTEFIDVENDRVRNIQWIDNEKFVYTDAHTAITGGFVDQSYMIAETSIDLIKCYSVNSNSIVWEQEFASSSVITYSGFFPLLENNAVAYYAGNASLILDIDTGDIIADHNVNDSIVNISDRDRDGWPIYVTRAGYLVFDHHNLTRDAVRMYDSFIDNIKQAMVCEGVYCLAYNSTCVTYYNTNVYDEDWTEATNDEAFDGSITSTFSNSRVVAFIHGDESTGTMLTVIDPDDNRVKCNTCIDENDYYGFNYTILGEYDGYIYYYYDGSLDYSIYKVGLNGRNPSKIFETDAIYNTDNIAGYVDGYLTYFAPKSNGKTEIVVMDLVNDDTFSFDIDIRDAQPSMKPVYLPSSNSVFFAVKDEGAFIYNVEEDEINEIDLPNDFNEILYVAASDNGSTLVIADDISLAVVDMEGTILGTIEGDGKIINGVSYCRNDELILVVYDDGSLYRYSASDYSFIEKMEISVYAVGDKTFTFIFDNENGYAYIQHQDVVDIVNMTEWVEEAYVVQSIAYSPSTNTFYTYAENDSYVYEVGYYRHYTLDELRERALTYLNGAELTEAQRTAYGL